MPPYLTDTVVDEPQATLEEDYVQEVDDVTQVVHAHPVTHVLFGLVGEHAPQRDHDGVVHEGQSHEEKPGDVDFTWRLSDGANSILRPRY